jgi:hypothetical protein
MREPGHCSECFTCATQWGNQIMATKNRNSSSSTSTRDTKGFASWTRNRTVLAAAGAAVVGAGAALFAWSRRARDDEPDQPAPALQRKKAAPGPVGKSGAARSAGPEAMRDPPAQWDREDQASDESFPASDPPPAQSKVD